MAYRLPRGLCRIYPNPFGLGWFAECADKKTFRYTRESARCVVRQYRAERYHILRAGDKEQARQEWSN